MEFKTAIIMSGETDKIISNVFQEVNKTIAIVGFQKVIQILKNSRRTHLDITEEQIKKSNEIITIVCDEYGIDYLDFFSNKRKNDRRKAIGTCAYFIENKLGIDNCNISYLLKKSEGSISTFKKEIIQLNENHPSDLKFIEKINNIKIKLKNNL